MNEQAEQKRDFVHPRTLRLSGCGATLAMRQTLDALGEDTIVVMPAGCWSTLIGTYPYTCLTVPVIFSSFRIDCRHCRGDQIRSFPYRATTIPQSWLGRDGGTFDKGLQALSVLWNETTTSSLSAMTTKLHERESSAPRPPQPAAGPPPHPIRPRSPSERKDIVEIMAAHRISYAATASIGFPEDLKSKVKKSKDINGSRFIHLFASCPTAGACLSCPSRLPVEAVRSLLFPLYEVFDGGTWTLNHMPDKVAVDTY